MCVSVESKGGKSRSSSAHLHTAHLFFPCVCSDIGQISTKFEYWVCVSVCVCVRLRLWPRGYNSSSRRREKQFDRLPNRLNVSLRHQQQNEKKLFIPYLRVGHFFASKFWARKLERQELVESGKLAVSVCVNTFLVAEITDGSEMDSTLDLDLDPSFEPQQRARSNTWPLPRPDNYVDIKDDADVDALCGMGPGMGGGLSGGGLSAGLALSAVGLGGVNLSGVDLLNGDAMGAGMGAGMVGGVGGKMADGSCSGAPKKNSSRRNAWGNMSYADLITQAIQSSPDKRLTLSQIYDWMVQNVPYFKDKGDSNSSAGWKVSFSFF